MSKRLLSKQELEDIEWMLHAKVPANPTFEFFLEKRMILLLSEMARHLGLNAFVIRRYAKAQAGRFEEMGICMIGNKFHVNTCVFARWGLTHRPTRRRMMLHFIDDLEAAPIGGDINGLLKTGKLYLYDDLSAAKLIPNPFCTEGGKETLLEDAENLENPHQEMGLFCHSLFKDWIVDPEPFFSYLGKKYYRMD